MPCETPGITAAHRDRAKPGVEERCSPLTHRMVLCVRVRWIPVLADGAFCRQKPRTAHFWSCSDSRGLVFLALAVKYKLKTPSGAPAHRCMHHVCSGIPWGKLCTAKMIDTRGSRARKIISVAEKNNKNERASGKRGERRERPSKLTSVLAGFAADRFALRVRQTAPRAGRDPGCRNVYSAETSYSSAVRGGRGVSSA